MFFISDDEDDHRCGPLYAGEHAVAEVIRGALSINHGALLGTQLEVRCRRGYHDRSNFCQPQIMQCVAPGIWKGQPPTCSKYFPILEFGLRLGYARENKTR